MTNTSNKETYFFYFVLFLIVAGIITIIILLTVEKNDPATTNSLPITESKSSTTTIAPTVNSPKPFYPNPQHKYLTCGFRGQCNPYSTNNSLYCIRSFERNRRTTNKNNCQIMSELLNKGICYSCGNFRNYHYGRSLSAADLWCKKTTCRQMSPKRRKKKKKKKKKKKQLGHS